MIPVAILAGLVAGLISERVAWWTIGIYAVAWPVLLVTTGVDSGIAFFVAAAALAAVNTVVGVAIGFATRWLTRALANRRRTHA